MAQAIAPEKIKTLELRAGAGAVSEFALFLLLVGLAFVAVYRMSPPSAVSSQAPAADFSSGRAMQHLRVITEQPHPVGTAEHARVREYITSEVARLGLNSEVQDASVAVALRRNSLRGGTVKNVLARLEGSDAAQHKALLLVGHYDSRMNSFGASDDGAAVATMLETLRALKSGATLKNDVIFLFSDAEEFGMLGTEAFVGQHPWAKDVGLVLNFEARGTRGPSVMFETSPGNSRLIAGLAEAAPHPVTNSLLYEIYKSMPNDTDLTVFKTAGLSGMNFAYINQPTNYHTSLDNYANLDERSLQHHGSYALSLARHFGNQDLSAPPANMRGNSIYFDLLGLRLAHYPAAWSLPLAGLVTLLFAGVFIYGRRKGKLTCGGATVAFGAFLLSLVVIPAIVAGLWWVLRAFNSNYRAMPLGDVYNSRFLYLGFVAISAAVFAAVFALLRRKVRVENLTAGAAFAWLILLWATSLMLPGASYLFAWPLAFSLLALARSVAAESPASTLKSVSASALGALPAIVLVVPVIYLLFIALTVRMAAVAVVVLVLLLGLLIPQLHLLTRRKSWLLLYVLVSVGAIFIGIGVAASGFNREQPKQNDVFYGMDADTGAAVWASTDPRPDAWSAQFFGRTPGRGTLEAYFPGLQRPFMKQDAPAATGMAAPEVKVLEDNSRNGVRTLRLKIVSARQAPLVSVYADAQADVQSVAINGRQVAAAPPQANATRPEPWVLRYYGLPGEGIEVMLEVKSSAPLRLRVVDQSYGLPAVGGSPSAAARPEGMMPATLPYSDSTLVSKSFSL